MRTIDIKQDAQTRAEILGAAQDLFQRYGLAKTTMNDIANATGKGKSTLYYYYPSKEDVFCAVIEREMVESWDTISKTIKLHKLPSQQFKAFIITRHDEVRRKMQMYKVLVAEGNKYPELYESVRMRYYEKERSLFREILQDGISAGEFKSIKEKDCDSLAIASVTMLRGLEADILFSGKVPSENIVLDAVTDIFLRGLC